MARRATSSGDCRRERCSAVVKVVILTGSELRHRFVAQVISLARGVEVLRTYRERTDGVLLSKIEAKAAAGGTELQRRHLAARAVSESDFFAAFVEFAPDHSQALDVARGAVNDDKVVEDICRLQPDLIAAYGCSLIRGHLLDAFAGRLLNVHLGLSPYYRGAGTNFWPLVNGEPEYVGATFMHMDAGIDTGEVLHQIRAHVVSGDTPHQIGNRLIRDMAVVYGRLLSRFGSLRPVPQLPMPATPRVYKMTDLSETAVRQAYEQLAGGMIERYLPAKEARDAAVPICVNPALADPAP